MTRVIQYESYPKIDDKNQPTLEVHRWHCLFMKKNVIFIHIWNKNYPKLDAFHYFLNPDYSNMVSK